MPLYPPPSCIHQLGVALGIPPSSNFCSPKITVFIIFTMTSLTINSCKTRFLPWNHSPHHLRSQWHPCWLYGWILSQLLTLSWMNACLLPVTIISECVLSVSCLDLWAFCYIFLLPIPPERHKSGQVAAGYFSASWVGSNHNSFPWPWDTLQNHRII